MSSRTVRHGEEGGVRAGGGSGVLIRSPPSPITITHHHHPSPSHPITFGTVRRSATDRFAISNHHGPHMLRPGALTTRCYHNDVSVRSEAPRTRLRPHMHPHRHAASCAFRRPLIGLLGGTFKLLLCLRSPLRRCEEVGGDERGDEIRERVDGKE